MISKPKPVENDDRIIRGGGRYGVAWFCQSVRRDRLTPDLQHDDFGFRLIRKVKNGKKLDVSGE